MARPTGEGAVLLARFGCARVTAMFDAVDAALADRRRFPVGDRLSAADIT
jgi:hypothetical protein